MSVNVGFTVTIHKIDHSNLPNTTGHYIAKMCRK